MARSKTRKRSGNKHSKNGSVLNSRAEIAALIDARKVEHDKKSGTVINKQSVEKFANEKLKKEFEDVMQRFQKQEGSAGPKEIIEDKESIEVATAEEKPVRDIKHTLDDELEDTVLDNSEEHFSARKRRKLEKPSLSQLKSQVPYPQVIEWYDCDARYPSLLASIKCTKNVIPVPNHWQSKKEYLSGRSLLGKRPFQLPDIIKKTNIEQMRSTLPQSGLDAQDEKSLKEASRVRVQPKMGTLDLDSKKLHDVFFKIGANWKPDHLLCFGDIYYENRNLFEEANWKRMVERKRPGRISQELRAIMNLPEGQLPPWCMKMKDVGLPTGYSDLKIAGLNWDITNLKGDVYGRIIPHHNSRVNKLPTNYFGALVSFEVPEVEILNGNSQEDAENRVPGGKISEETELKIDHAQDNISEVIDLERKIEKNEGESKRKLYTVLK